MLVRRDDCLVLAELVVSAVVAILLDLRDNKLGIGMPDFRLSFARANEAAAVAAAVAVEVVLLLPGSVLEN
jgi:hypothetical protein